MTTTTNDPAPQYGSAAHAARITEGRHPGVQTALAWLAFVHLPANLQEYSAPLYNAAVNLVHSITSDSAELTTALNTLVEAKDWAVRAGVRAETGRPGPVPRPVTIVDPPIAAGMASAPMTRPDFRGPIDNRIGPNFGRPIQDRPQA